MLTGANDYFRHIHADQLEEYALHRLSEPETAAVEEHLLVCEDCRDGLRSIEEVISATRATMMKPPGLIKSN